MGTFVSYSNRQIAYNNAIGHKKFLLKILKVNRSFFGGKLRVCCPSDEVLSLCVLVNINQLHPDDHS
jgi:hypothetical protein